MALDSGYWESEDNYMSTDEVATLLVRLFADYYNGIGGYENENTKKYSEAVGIAIRLLHDCD